MPPKRARSGASADAPFPVLTPAFTDAQVAVLNILKAYIDSKSEAASAAPPHAKRRVVEDEPHEPLGHTLLFSEWLEDGCRIDGECRVLAGSVKTLIKEFCKATEAAHERAFPKASWITYKEAWAGRVNSITLDVAALVRDEKYIVEEIVGSEKVYNFSMLIHRMHQQEEIQTKPALWAYRLMPLDFYEDPLETNQDRALGWVLWFLRWADTARRGLVVEKVVDENGQEFSEENTVAHREVTRPWSIVNPIAPTRYRQRYACLLVNAESLKTTAARFSEEVAERRQIDADDLVRFFCEKTETYKHDSNFRLVSSGLKYRASEQARIQSDFHNWPVRLLPLDYYGEAPIAWF